MRLIDADALIDRIESDIKAIEDTEPVMAIAGIGVLNTVKKAPTVLAVVHCKDCNHSYEAIIEQRADGYEDEAIICKRLSVGGEVRVPPDFYCGYGERKAESEGE